MQSHKVVNRKYSESNQIAEKPLSKKKFAALMQKMRSGELRLSDIEVAPPARGVK